MTEQKREMTDLERHLMDRLTEITDLMGPQIAAAKKHKKLVEEGERQAAQAKEREKLFKVHQSVTTYTRDNHVFTDQKDYLKKIDKVAKSMCTASELSKLNFEPIQIIPAKELERGLNIIEHTMNHFVNTLSGPGYKSDKDKIMSIATDMIEVMKVYKKQLAMQCK